VTTKRRDFRDAAYAEFLLVREGANAECLRAYNAADAEYERVRDEYQLAIDGADAELTRTINAAYAVYLRECEKSIRKKRRKNDCA